jgi:hypothetical protein
MADKAVGDYTVASPNSDDSVLGWQNGMVKRFAVSDLAAGVALADAGGAGLVGFDASETYPAGTVGAKLGEAPTTPYDEGAIGNGIADDTDAVLAWATNGKKHKSWGTGRFLISAEITFEADTQLTGNGEASVVVIDPAFIGSYPIKNTPGTLTAITGPSAAMTRGDSSLTFAAAPELSADDVFIIYNPTDYSWSGFRTYYRAGEFCEAAAVGATTVRLKNALYDSYVAADVDTYRMAPDRSCFENFVIEGAASTGLIFVSLGMNNRVKVRATNANNSCVVFDRCIYPSIGEGTDLANAGDGGEDDALIFSNCQHGRVPDSFHGYARRQAVTCGGDDVVCCVPCRDILVGGVLQNDLSSGIAAADFHGNCDDCHFINAVSRGVSLGGRNVSYRGGTLTNISSGNLVYMAEIKGGTFGVYGTKLSSTVDPDGAGLGLIDAGGSASNTVSAYTTEDFTIEVHDCSLRGRNFGASTIALLMLNRGASVNINLSVQRLALDVDSLNTIIRTQLVSGVADSNHIIADKITGAPSGTKLAFHVASAYSAFPHRMQKQSGVYVGETTAAAFVAGPDQTYPMSYPRVPNETISVRGASGGDMSALAGQLGVAAQAYNVTATTFRPMISAAAAFTAGTAYEQPWTVGLDEC